MSDDRTHHGEAANRGRIVVGTQYPNEGYAVVRCGNTEVQIGYTLLHNTHLGIDGEAARFTELCDLQRALYSITCEASLGRTGDHVITTKPIGILDYEARAHQLTAAARAVLDLVGEDGFRILPSDPQITALRDAANPPYVVDTRHWAIKERDTKNQRHLTGRED